MIHVIASIIVRQDKMPDLLKIYETFIPKVNMESGCIMYSPTMDLKTDIVTQKQEANVVTVIEKWDNIAAFKEHLSAPHVIEFREDIKGVVDKVSIKISTNALP